MAVTGSSSWLIPRPSMFNSVSVNADSSFSFFASSRKPIAAASLSSCLSHSTHQSSSSSISYSRRWYNPLRRRPYDVDNSPDISRRWIEADQPPASLERFTVVSYNILAARNALKHKDLYTNVNPLYLKWAHRKRVICEQLVGWNADIICLQEVDRYSDLLSVMEKAGYAGSYKRRTGDNVDGCAMFWKADKLRLLEGESIEFKVLGLRDNVAQLSIFEVAIWKHALDSATELSQLSFCLCG